MKPSDFKLNTDYLTLANVENLTLNVAVPASQIPNSGTYTINNTYKCKNIPIAITRACMHHSTWANDSLYAVGRAGQVEFKDSSQNVYHERIRLTTPNGDTLGVKIDISGTAGTTAPAHTITIKVFRFRVPNVF